MHIWVSERKDDCERNGYVAGHDWERVNAKGYRYRRCRHCGTTISRWSVPLRDKESG